MRPWSTAIGHTRLPGVSLSGYIAAAVIATGLAFGGAYALGRWASGGIGVAAGTGAAAVSTRLAEASTSTVAPRSNTDGTIPRIDMARGTTMQTCNSGSVMPIGEPASAPTGSGQGPAPTGRTSAITPNAQIAAVALEPSWAQGSSM